jgi:hypothetical protein
MPRRAPTRALTFAALLVAALLSAPAGAGSVTVQGTGTAAAGYNDNVLNAPDERTTMGPAREGDALFQLIPGVVLASTAPRILQRASYTLAVDLYARHSEADSYSNTIDWTGNVLTSPTTSLLLTLQSQQGKVSTFNINQASGGTTITLVPQNSNHNYFSQTASEAFTATPTPHWRVTERLSLKVFAPLEQGTLPNTYDLLGEVGFDRIFHVDALGLVLRADFVDLVEPRDPVTDVPIGFDQRLAITSLIARWRRDWSPSWNTEAALGVISIVGASADPTLATQTAWEPSALAALRFERQLGSGELRYAHDVAANTLVGGMFSTDQVALQASVPLVRERLFLGATVAYQHSLLLSLIPGATEAKADLVIADVTLGWQPIPELRVFARYSFLDQFGSPPVGDIPSLLPDLTRNLVMAGVNVIYPAVVTARLPSSHEGSRVDGSDEAAFPEVHTPQPQ